jgi:hypothetical protein
MGEYDEGYQRQLPMPNKKEKRHGGGDKYQRKP